MQWEDVSPVIKAVSWATASMYINSDGKPRIRVSFSEAMMNACGHPTAANVQTAIRGDDCLVRFVWAADGRFPIKGLERGGARISAIPAKIPPCPGKACAGEPCEVEAKSPTEAILILPIKAWAEQGRTPPRIVTPPAAPRVAAATGKVDGVNYLRGKGVKISRMAGDYYNVNGDKTPKVEVCKLINQHRKGAELPPIGVDNFD